MDYSKKQKELDVKKWVDSETKNYDTCGEYEYCKNCNKNLAYPCAYAYETYKGSTNFIKTTTCKNSVKTSKTSTKKPAKKATTKKVKIAA